MITPLLHAITIIRTSVRTVAILLHVLPYHGWCPDGVDLSFRHMHLSSHIRVWEWIPNSPRILTGVRTILPRHPDGCTWTVDSSRTLKSVQTCCHDVRTDGSLNNLNLLNIDGCPGRMYGPFGQNLGIRILWLEICTESSLYFLKHIS